MAGFEVITEAHHPLQHGDVSSEDELQEMKHRRGLQG
jgi:hypothetical protein